MYIADFYNRIIGHYEVPLTHPGRDRTSGRIWRIAYTGKAEGTKPARKPNEVDFTKLNTAELIQHLSSPQLEHRLRVQHWMADVVGRKCTPEIDIALKSTRGTTPQTVHLLWLREVLKDGQGGDIENGRLIGEEFVPNRDFEVHIRKLFSERAGLFLEADILHDSFPPEQMDGFIARAGADALGRDPRWPAIKWLVQAQPHVAANDVLLQMTIKIALRNHLAVADKQQSNWVEELGLTDEEVLQLAPLYMAINAPTAAKHLIAYVEKQSDSPANTVAYLQHAAQFATDEDISSVIRFTQTKFASDVSLQVEILLALRSGLAQRGIAADESLKSWGEELAKELLTSDAGETIPWTPIPIEGLPPSENPWVVQQRASGDGDKDSLFFSSLPKGEQRTGIYRSGSFLLPAKLSFWCAGHSGFAEGPINDKNYIRLRDAEMQRTARGIASATERYGAADRVGFDEACRQDRLRRTRRRRHCDWLRVAGGGAVFGGWSQSQ